MAEATRSAAAVPLAPTSGDGGDPPTLPAIERAASRWGSARIVK